MSEKEHSLETPFQNDVITTEVPAETPAEVPAEVPVEAPAEAPVETSPKRRPSKHTVLSKVTYADNLVRHGDVFLASFDEPICLQTPTVTLASEIDDESVYATFKVKRAHIDTFAHAEEALLAAAKEKSAAWFGQDLDASFIESCFKRFVDADARHVTVRLDDGFPSGLSVGSKCKLVLEAEGALFTKKQFGLVLIAKAAKLVTDPSSQYLFDDEEIVDAVHVSDALLQDAGTEYFE